MAGLAEHVGLLGEMVPWPFPSAAYVMEPLPLRVAPLEALGDAALAATGGAACLYGLIPVGTGADPGITVALRQDPILRICADEGNDETLANDRERIDGIETPLGAVRWWFTVQVEYAPGDGGRSPYHVGLLAYRDPFSGELELFYSGFCHRRGLLDLGTSVVAIAINSLDSTGRYDDVAQLVVAVDADENGELDLVPGSHEVFAPGEPIQIGTSLYELESVSADGRRIVVREAGHSALRPILEVGEVAPDFELATLAGSRVTFSALRGKPVVLLLSYTPPSADCSTCSNDTSAAWARLTEFVDLARAFTETAVFMIVLTDTAPEPELDFGSVPGNVFIGRSPDVGKTYRRAVGGFVIDSLGVIAAMDRTWMSFACGLPQGGTEILSPDEVLAALAKLLNLEE
jgi:peroxiredoxin